MNDLNDSRRNLLKDKPGLGVELNEEVCQRHLSKGSGFFE